MKKLLSARLIVASVAMFCVSLGAYADETYMYTDAYGQTWTYVGDGIGTDVTMVGNIYGKTSPFDAANIPWTFTTNGTTYTVTKIDYQAFDYKDISIAVKLSGVMKVSKSVVDVGGFTFRYSDLSAFYIPGPDSGTANVSVKQPFRNAASLKIVFIGPNTKPMALNDNNMLLNVHGCKVFVPANGNWDTFNPNGGNTTVDNEAIYYGTSTNLNLIVEDDKNRVTAIPTDGTAFAKMLEVAPLFKTYFGWDTSINVTNLIEVGAGVITTANTKWVNSFNSLVFKVNTQEQLDTLLDAVPSSVPFAINPLDASERLTLPQGREVYVRLSGEGRDGKYIPKIVNGVIIRFL